MTVSSRTCVALLGSLVALVIVVSLGASLLSHTTFADPVLNHAKESFVRLAWVDGEGNIPSWFSTSLLFVVALLLTIIAAAERRMGAARATQWGVLGLIFLFLSLDETAQLHELSIVPIRNQLGANGFIYYAWILPAGLGVGILILAYLRFLAHLPARTRRLLLSAGAVYVGGALGIGSISGWQAAPRGEHNLGYHLIVTLEELCEMAGVVLFIYALLDYLGGRFTRLGFHIRSASGLNRS
ncbi:MAG TPA: hypothetical protein VFZ87_02040 [Gemmatimonadales bacterium]